MGEAGVTRNKTSLGFGVGSGFDSILVGVIGVYSFLGSSRSGLAPQIVLRSPDPKLKVQDLGARATPTATVQIVALLASLQLLHLQRTFKTSSACLNPRQGCNLSDQE